MRKALCFLVLLILPIAAKAADSVDLLWQGETYTPPFYEGRSLWTNQSRVDFHVIPHISGFDPSTLYYRWTKDGTVLGNLSGINKRSLTLTDTVLSLPIEVKIDIRNGENGDILASNTIALTPIPGKTVVVEDNPLYGLIFNKAILDEFDLSGSEVTFAALPYFWPVSARAVPAMNYTWTMNGADPRTGNEVTYRAPEGANGSSLVDLKVNDSVILTLPQDKSFSVKFGQQNAL